MSYMRDICLMCVLYYLFTYFAGIAPCMGLRVSFVLFHLSKCYIDYVYVYVYTFDYLCIVLNKIVIKKSHSCEKRILFFHNFLNQFGS